MLPVADDSISRKKTLWKTVFEGFDRIDGVPTLAEKEVSECCNTDVYKYNERDVFTSCVVHFCDSFFRLMLKLLKKQRVMRYKCCNNDIQLYWYSII